VFEIILVFNFFFFTVIQDDNGVGTCAAGQCYKFLISEGVSKFSDSSTYAHSV